MTRRRPSSFTRSVISSPQVGLIWNDSASNGSRRPGPVRRPVVVQDDLLVHLLQLHYYPTPKKSRAARTPSTSAATSSGVLYTAKVARTVAATPKRRCSGHAQWWPDPHRHAAVVEHLPDVVGVHAVDDERHGATAVREVPRPDDPHARHLRQPVQRSAGERELVGEHGLHPEAVEVVDGRAQADGLRRHRHARLEPLRRRGVGRPLHPHQLDHRPAGEERRHRREQLAPPPQHADPGRAEHLVPGERREVDAQRGEVHRLVRHRLAGVEQRQRPDGPGPRHQLRDRQHGAEHVALVGERHDLRALRQLERVEVQPAVGRHAVPAQDGAGAPAQLLPRHQVRVVLQLGDDDLVAGLEREPRRLRAERGADRRVARTRTRRG